MQVNPIPSQVSFTTLLSYVSPFFYRAICRAGPFSGIVAFTEAIDWRL